MTIRVDLTEAQLRAVINVVTDEINIAHARGDDVETTALAQAESVLDSALLRHEIEKENAN